MDDILKYLLMLAPGLLQGLTRPGGQQAPQQRTTIADLPERRFEGIAENIMGQMARAGQPRRTVSTSTLTQPEEPLNWGNLMMILMMLMQGQPNVRPEDIGPPAEAGHLEPAGEAPRPM